MTPDLKTLRSLCEAATPGPWASVVECVAYHECDDADIFAIVLDAERRQIVSIPERAYDTRPTVNIEADAAFIAAANPSAVLSLLDRVEALEERDDLAMQIISENAKLRREAEAMAETVRTLEAERDRLREAGDALAEAAYLHMGTHPVFRMKPTGFEGSRARLQQTDQIETENALMTAVKEWKSNDRL